MTLRQGGPSRNNLGMTNTQHDEITVTRVGRSGQPAATAGLEELTTSACWEHLATQRLGRIAFVHDDRVEIFPVNYAVGENALVFRSAPGTKVANADGARCAFEVDFYDELRATGWSVVAQGALFCLTRAGAERIRRAGLAVHTVAPGDKAFWLVIDVDELSGRTFNAGVMVPHWN